jgi:UDP-3-O-[3-hydroxymyristoyl] N-acetylglucosamine deacetylase
MISTLNNQKQFTVKNVIKLKGIGLHSGTTVHLHIHPAPSNHGIVFLRSDLRESPKIKADITKVCRTDMCTVLGNENHVVATVEHLMAAFSALKIDNALVEVSAPEVPIMDGSAIEFINAILDVGIKECTQNKKILRLTKEISVTVGDKIVEAKPKDDFIINCMISFNHPLIGTQSYQYNSNTDFQTEIAKARTFGFLREVEYLHKKGLALGGSLENAVVLDDEKILNPEGLRFANEFVRHKVLDAVGDFALIGLPILAEINLFKSGHEMHALFLRKILEDPHNYEIVELESIKLDETNKERAMIIA